MKLLLWTTLLFTLSPAAFAQLTDESSAGIVVTNGNSDTQSENLKQGTKYTFSKNSLGFTGSYLQAKQNGITSAENWLAALRYERSLSELVTTFFSQSVEGDRFAGFSQRYNSDLGAQYFLIKSDKDLIWLTEAGYRFTHENETNAITNNFQKGRFYTEAEKYWAPTTSTKIWVEYLPNFTLPQGWQMNGEVSVTSSLNSIFSIKSAFLVRYNNAPPVVTAVKSDTAFTTSLVAKF